MKRIIVPTDFSDCALTALNVAASMARKAGLGIDLVHSYALPALGYESGQVAFAGFDIAQVREELKGKIDALANHEFLQGLEVKTHVLTANDVADFLDMDELDSNSMVVMGTHGASGWREEFIGSNAEKVIRKSEFPVFAVRKDTPSDFAPKKIVFASNYYGEVYDRFQQFKDFADLFGAEIVFVRINTPSSFESSSYSELMIGDFKKKFGMEDSESHIYNDYSVVEGVLNFSRRVGADMIAMETHGRRGFNHFVNGSVAEEVVNHANIPLMTIKIKEPEKPKGVIFPEVH